MISLLLSFAFALVVTFGFCILFHVPKRHIPAACFIGASGWMCFEFCGLNGYDQVASCFMAACLVAFLSDICSRIFKEAITIFVIPGILPLVPGARAYHTMTAFIANDFDKTLTFGTETVFMACSIALALMAVASTMKVIVFISRRLTQL